MSVYARRIHRTYPFPQADSSSRILDTLDLVCAGPIDDEGIAKAMGVTPRQGAYYSNGAAFIGIVRDSGGYWRPTAQGRGIFEMDDADDRRSALSAMILALPVFDKAAEHVAYVEEMPPVDEIVDWIMAREPDLNEVTATRRANTVHSWVSDIWERDPGMVLRAAEGTGPGIEQEPMRAFAP